MKNIPPLSKDDFNLFRALMVEETGLYFEQDRGEPLQYALSERLQKRECDSYSEYYDLLKFSHEGSAEMRELLDIITTSETYFFRNGYQFDVLKRFVLPEIIERKRYSPDRSIRIWSAGCSYGCEPYSIAITVIETLPDYEDWNISILGTDVNRNALIRAQEAVYEQSDLKGRVSRAYLDKYFQQKGKSHILNEQVKKMVRFEYHNLAKDPFSMDGMRDLDIVFCRNVTMYFDLETTKRVIDNFYDCLAVNGVLFLGHAEMLWYITDKFQSIDFPQTFIYKKIPHWLEKTYEKSFVYVPDITCEEIKISEAEKESDTTLDASYEKAMQFFNANDYEKALKLFDEIIARDNAYTQAYFAKATVLTNQMLYEDAKSALAKLIAMDNLNALAHYMMGALLVKTGDMNEAEAQFRKVVYLDPGFILAYFNLGNMYLSQKKFDKARHEFTNTVKLLQKKEKDERLMFCEDLTVDFLLQACRKIIAEIDLRGGEEES